MLLHVSSCFFISFMQALFLVSEVLHLDYV